MTAHTAQSRIQLEALTGMRGLAAIYVVLYHLRSGQINTLPEWMIVFLSKGYLAVDLFFILSGFVMWISYADKFSASGVGIIKDFLWRRFARIYPLHLAILLAMTGFAVMLKLTGRDPGQDMSFAELPFHLLLIQNWGLVDAVRWNDPAWSISAEFAAYLVFPAIALWADWNQRNHNVLWAAIIGLLVLIGLGFHLSGYPTLGSGISEMGVFRCIVQFTIGTALASLWLRHRQSLHAPTLLAISVAIMLAGLTAQLDEPVFVPAALAALMLATALSGEKLKFLSRGPVHYLGTISYAVYLSHMFLYTLFKLIFVDDASNVGLPAGAAFLLGVLVISAVLYHYLELPAQRALNGLGKSEKLAKASG